MVQGKTRPRVHLKKAGQEKAANRRRLRAAAEAKHTNRVKRILDCEPRASVCRAIGKTKREVVHYICPQCGGKVASTVHTGRVGSKVGHKGQCKFRFRVADKLLADTS